MKFKEGDRVVTCGQVSGFHRTGYYFGTRVYAATVRKRDGVLIWRMVHKSKGIAGGYDPPPEAVKLARVYADENGLPYVADVKDKQPVKGTHVPRSQTAKVRKRVPAGNRFDRILRDTE